MKRKNEYLLVPVHAQEFRLARRVRPSRPTSVCSFSSLMLNLVLTRGIPPDFRGNAHLFIRPYAIGSVPSLSGHAIAYRWRSLPESTRTGPVGPPSSSSNGCCLRITMDQLCAPLFFHTHYCYEIGMLKVSEARGKGYWWRLSWRGVGGLWPRR